MLTELVDFDSHLDKKKNTIQTQNKFNEALKKINNLSHWQQRKKEEEQSEEEEEKKQQMQFANELILVDFDYFLKRVIQFNSKTQ